MRYKFIYDTIMARIAGTAMNVGFSRSESGLNTHDPNVISVRGIKSFTRLLVDEFFNRIVEALPDNFELFSADTLLPVLEQLCQEWDLSKEFLQREIERLQSVPEAWNSMDREQKTAFYIHSFFTTLESHLKENVLKSGLLNDFLDFYQGISMEGEDKDAKAPFQTLFLSCLEKGKISFCFRAICYVSFANSFLFSGGFQNLEKRLKKEFFSLVSQEISKKECTASSFNGDSPLSSLQMQEDLKEVVKKLKSDNKAEVLEAITYIRENHIKEALDDLEYLLSSNDEEIMEAAFETVMDLKGLSR